MIFDKKTIEIDTGDQTMKGIVEQYARGEFKVDRPAVIVGCYARGYGCHCFGYERLDRGQAGVFYGCDDTRCFLFAEIYGKEGSSRS